MYIFALALALRPTNGQKKFIFWEAPYFIVFVFFVFSCNCYFYVNHFNHSAISIYSTNLSKHLAQPFSFIYPTLVFNLPINYFVYVFNNHFL